MKRIAAILIAALAAATFAFAEYGIVELTDGGTFVPASAARVAAVRAVSSVADGTVAVKSVATLHVVSNAAVVTYSTNYTYTAVWTNGTGAVTNTSSHELLPLGSNVTSYVTNTIVTASTNWVPTASSSVSVTNTIASFACSGGTGSTNPASVYLIPGEPVFFEGTASGRVTLVVEK